MTLEPHNLIPELIETTSQLNLDAGELFEAVIRCAYEDIIEPGDRVIDIGANAGLHLFPMVRAVGWRGKVYAFEPLPHLLKYLQRQALKKFLFNIRFYELALGLEDKQSSFKYFREFPGFSGLQKRLTPFSDQEGGLQEIRVQQKRLDDVLPANTAASLIKIDIEGGELHALMGGRQLLQNSRPVILFECGFQNTADTYNYTMEDFFGFFEGLGYSVFSLAGDVLTRDDWHIHPCWELLALPDEKQKLATRFPGYCQQVLDSARLAVL